MIERMRIILADWRLYAFGSAFLFIMFYYFAFAAPSGYPVGTIATLGKGVGLATLADELAESHVIRSPLWFRAAVIVLGGERGLKAGDYFLRDRQNGIKLAWRMVKAERDLALVKITVPEGFTVAQIADLFDKRFLRFSKSIFLATAPEGYVFPDTYFIEVNATSAAVIELFRSNYDRQIAKLAADFKASKHTEGEIIVMASILEDEVQTPEDKALVAGILWKRLTLGMPLQVDSAGATYKVLGLPNKPLNNPGLISIKAALNPTASPYLYFISGKDGTIHYAKTIDEQTRNIQKYL
ncbi:endolytic transglycosylase MltG [Candidatus Parcubacteria bacterium]|nr:endolytic transglycosylase MltG [Candidatus Parcubacteria bacterium]